MQIVVAKGPEDILQKLQTHTDIVLLLVELKLLQEDNQALLNRLKEQVEFSAPVIALGYEAEPSLSGVSGWLQKPVDERQLLQGMVHRLECGA